MAAARAAGAAGCARSGAATWCWAASPAARPRWRACPPAGVTLEEKHDLHRLLLALGRCGSARSTPSASTSPPSRAGGWRRRWPAPRIVNLTVSDVAGDALDAITDPTVPDTTTVADAIAVLRSHDLLGPGRRPRSAASRVGRRRVADARRRRRSTPSCWSTARRPARRWPSGPPSSATGRSCSRRASRARAATVGATLVDLGRESARSGRAVQRAVHADRLRRRDHRHDPTTARSSAPAAPTRRRARGGTSARRAASRSPRRSSTPTAPTAARTPPARSSTGTRRPRAATPASTCARRCSRARVGRGPARARRPDRDRADRDQRQRHVRDRDRDGRWSMIASEPPRDGEIVARARDQALR